MRAAHRNAKGGRRRRHDLVNVWSVECRNRGQSCDVKSWQDRRNQCEAIDEARRPGDCARPGEEEYGCGRQNRQYCGHQPINQPLCWVANSKVASLYLTRKRELALIHGCDNYQETFPHLLNFFPLRSLAPVARWNAKVLKAREEYVLRIVTKSILSISRSMIVLAITIPMLALGGYSEYLLWSMMSDMGLSDILVPSLVIIVACLIILNAVAQEWEYGWSKEFVRP